MEFGDEKQYTFKLSILKTEYRRFELHKIIIVSFGKCKEIPYKKRLDLMPMDM